MEQNSIYILRLTVTISLRGKKGYYIPKILLKEDGCPGIIQVSLRGTDPTLHKFH